MTAVIDEGTGRGESPAPHEDSDRPGRTPDRPTRVPEAGGDWNDGLIARRAAAMKADPGPGTADDDVRTPQVEAYVPSGGPLRPRLDALRELVGLSRARLDGATLAEAGRVLDEAAARRRLSSRHTVVAIAGATGSGKSALFNSLAGVQISETGLRRPTTAAPIACSWTDGAAGLLDRLAIPGRLRRRPQQGGTDADEALQGLVLVDLPDHDSAAPGHREQVDRVLALVDAVIWVVDPEKYADAALHERYLRPLAGHAEVTFVVLNQIDRLPGDAADQVLDDLRRLLDEDGMALGEHGEPGATVMSLSALTGDGVGELREVLGRFVQERTAAARRLSADVDAAAARLRPVYVAEGRPGLGERAREEFADRLAEAVGAAAAGQAAEREWRRNAGRACRTPWLRLWRWYESARRPGSLECPALPAPVEEELTARQRVEQAVRTVADEAADGLPGPWAQAVREAAVNGADGLPEALDELVEKAGRDEGRERPASSSPGGGTGGSGGGAAQGGSVRGFDGDGDAGGWGLRCGAQRSRGREATAAPVVARRGAGAGVDDAAADLRRALAGRPDRRRARTGIPHARPGDAGRGRRRAVGGVVVCGRGAGTGATVRAGGRAAVARGGGGLRPGAGARSGGGGARAVPRSAGAVRGGDGVFHNCPVVHRPQREFRLSFNLGSVTARVRARESQSEGEAES